MRQSMMWSAVLALVAAQAMASEDIADKYPQSELYDKPVEVIPHVWSAIGATAPPTYENAGQNHNRTCVVTGDGVVVVNGGASARLAAALHDEIKAVTDQPVKLVINENGQGHAMLGNSYWADLGVDILAHVDAIAEVEAHGGAILAGMQGYNKDRAEGTRVAVPNLSFEDRHDFTMGDVAFEVLHLGPAHGPGDTRFVVARAAPVHAPAGVHDPEVRRIQKGGQFVCREERMMNHGGRLA